MRVATFMTMVAAVSVAAAPAAEWFVPDGRVDPDGITVLMAADAPLPDGTTEFQPGGHGKFFIDCPPESAPVFRWEITIPAAAEYAVRVLARRGAGPEPELSVTCADRVVRGRFTAPAGAWEREAIPGTIRLPAGRQTLVLKAESGPFPASLFSLELVRPEVRDRLAAAARELRADTGWLRGARFGLMCHWTSQTFPREGPRNTYAEAVRAFDVDGLARQVAATGAGFLVLTTSHAEMYFPAPIRALDRILPGRTSERDLVADLADALSRRGIRLMLYYHPGSGSDPEWLRACGFRETDTRRLFDSWVAVIGEVGQRYGDRLAGWWFDDGAVNLYYRSAPWERLTRAAKAGDPSRLVGYNPWELPATTEFQDFFCGEGFGDPGSNGRLRPGGDGRLTHGSHAGLQACATLVAESDWVHARPDTDIGPPRWDAEALARLIRQFGAYGNVPIFNLEIYREGFLSDRTVDTFRAAANTPVPE